MIEALLSLGLLIIAAKLAEAALARFGVNSTIAYAATGILLGPVAGLVTLDTELQIHELDIFLHIGIFLFFFLVGLDEIDLPSFRATLRGRFFVAASVSVVVSVTSALFVASDLFPVGFALGLDFMGALALSGALSLSSLGLVTKVLADSGHLKKPIGLEIFTVVAAAQLIGLLLIGFALGERQHGPNLSGLLSLLAHIGIFTAVAWVLSAKLLPRAIDHLERLANVPELAFGIVFGGLFLIVAGTEKVGVHGSMGALLFGVALSGLTRRVHREITRGLRSAADGIFVPLFFAAAGLHLDLSFLTLPAATIAVLTAVPLAGKFLGAVLGAYAARLDKPYAQAAGLMAKGVAEIAILLVLFEAGIIGQEAFSLFVIVMLGCNVLMPPVISAAVSRATRTHQATIPDAVPPSFARHALEDITLNHILDRNHPCPGPDLSIQEFSDTWTTPNQRNYLVVDKGEVFGIVSLSRLRLVPAAKWATTPLREVVRSAPPAAAPEDHLEDALTRMTQHGTSIIPVRDRKSGEFLGSVISEEIVGLIALMDEIAEELERRREGVTGDEVLERISLVERTAEELRRRSAAERRA